MNGLGLAVKLRIIIIISLIGNGLYSRDYLFNLKENNENLNILLIISEDNSANLGCYGDPWAKTPNLDRLSSQGVLFENAYVAQSVCSSSRSTIFTGLYPHQNGQIGLATHNYAMFHDWGTSYNYLKSSGYTTALIGKTHVNPEQYVEDHVDFRFMKQSNFSKKDLEEYWLKAGAFMKNANSPFFITVNFPDAHWPLQNQVQGKPVNPQSIKEVGSLPFIGVETPTILQSLEGYYNSMQRLDECVGNLLEQLELSGKEENTVVIYLSDHGAQMARGKINVLEGGTKIPLLIKWPDITIENSTTEALWSTIDLLPTLMDIAGITIPDYLPGRSAKPLLKGDILPEEYREYLYTQRNCDAVVFNFPQRTVRNERYKLIWSPLRDRPDPAAEFHLGHKRPHYLGSPTYEELLAGPDSIQRAYKTWEFPPLYQLYDLKEDPWEFNDLSDAPEFQSVKKLMIEKLHKWQIETNDPLANPGLLEELTKEHDLLSNTNTRVPKNGWNYLNYLNPLLRDSINEDHFALPSSGIRYFTVAKIGSTPVVNTDNSRYTGIREPNSIITKNGTLVVVFGPHDIAAKNDRAHQDLICRTSINGGKSWIDPMLIMDRGMESLLPTTLIYDKELDRVVLLVNQIFNAPEREDPLGLKAPNKHFVLFSEDDGKTWTEPKPILPDVDGICVFGGGHGFQLSVGPYAGRLIVPGGIGPRGAKPGIWYSDDHGMTWLFSEVWGTGNTEATGCELPDGRLLLSWRELKSQFGVRVALSEDDVMNIGERKLVLPDVWAGCNNSLLSIIVDDKPAVLYIGPLGPNKADKYQLETQAKNLKIGAEDSYQAARSNGGAFISFDNGKSWTGKCIADNWIFGYNTVVQFQDGDIGVIFEGIPPGEKDLKNKGWDKKQLGIYMAKFSPLILVD